MPSVEQGIKAVIKASLVGLHSGQYYPVIYDRDDDNMDLPMLKS